jgi:predicted nuclease with RNAse H fold
LTCSTQTVVGIDVGGRKKGFHAVALRASTVVDTLVTCRADEVVKWCRDHDATIVGIDAPCKWSLTGRARSCERELAALGLSTFSTPSLVRSRDHPFYGWMLNGAELFGLLKPHYRLFDGRTSALGRLCFETFPQAVASALAGTTLLARDKRADRRRVLIRAGIVTDALTNIDRIDATLCAVAAQDVLAGTFQVYGDDAEGFIVVSRP